MAAGAAAETRGLTIQLKANEAKDAPVAGEVRLYGASYALVIGIDKYTGGWPRLSNAVKDARLVAAELERKGFEVTLKTNLAAAELEGAFKEFFIVKGADPTARLFVWYAGHGYSEDDEGFLIPADAPPPEAGPRFKFKALPIRRFGEYVRLARSKHAYAVFDACFAGTIFTMQRSRPPAAITHATTMPVRQFLTSGDAGQTVSDDGTFRELILRALSGEERADANGDGYVTATEMGLFLDDRVTNLTEARQTPRYGKLRDKDFDLGDFVFALAEPPPRRTSTPASPTAPPTGMTAEMMFWQSMKDSADPDNFQAYLDQFPNGTFARLARLELKKLKKAQVAMVRPAPAPRKQASADAGGFLVQVATMRSEERARGEWERLRRNNGDLLGKLRHLITRVDLGPGKGIFYRLRVGPLASKAEAKALCASLAAKSAASLSGPRAEVAGRPPSK